MILRFVEIQISEPYFAPAEDPVMRQLPSPEEFGVAPDERIVAVREFTTYSGSMNHTGTLHARIWIGSPVASPASEA